MYKITITKVDTKTVTKRGEYTTIDKRPWTEEEVAEERSGMYRNLEQFLEKNPLKQVMGYAPNFQTSESVEVEILKQAVETLDLAAVIKAVNGL